MDDGDDFELDDFVLDPEELAEEFDGFDDEGGDEALPGTAGRSTESGTMTWSAWDVGVVFGLGGWLLDQHAEAVGEQIRRALAENGRSSGSDVWRGAPHPPPSSGHPYSAGVAPLRVGEPLDPMRLYSEVMEAIVSRRDLVVQAEGDRSPSGRLVLVVSVVPSLPGPRAWVVVEERPGGFAAARLVPVFQPHPDGGLAAFATDYAYQAADAVAWACRREGMETEQLTVMRKA